MCSDGDISMDFTKCMSNIDDQKQLYVAKCKVWQERECTVLVNTAPILKQLLAFEMPLTCHEISKECLRRLKVSQDLISDLSTNAEICSIIFGKRGLLGNLNHEHHRSKVASAMASAMSPESQILELLKNETSDYSKIRELHDKHLKLYDILKEEENKRVQKVCEEEKQAFVSETLNRKTQLKARLDRAKITTKDILSSQDILARMIQKVEEVVKKVEDKQKDSLQRLPKSKCSVCFTKFSLKRKRACINPCGHASTCFDCAGHEYKRTKTCPLCKCGMDQKPVALPGDLYF